MAFSLALYLAFPFIQITCTPLVLRGVGMRTWRDEREAISKFGRVKAAMWANCIDHRLDFNGAHLNFLGQQRGFEVGLDDHLHLQLSAANLPYQRDDSEWQDDVFSGAVPARKGGGQTTAHVTKCIDFIMFIHTFLKTKYSVIHPWSPKLFCHILLLSWQFDNN